MSSLAAPPAASNATRERVVLTAVCATTVLVIGFVAAINLAVPDLAASGLHPSSSQLVWIVDAYVVLFACLVIPAGALGDRYGRKGVLLAGLAVLAAGALVSALAGDVAVMLAGRVISGIGAAAVLPNGLAVLVHATDPIRRPRAIAVWAAASGAGGVIGNVGGGALLQAGSWRWLFAAVVPLAIGCATWIAAAAPRSEHHDRRVDLRSAGMLTCAVLALLIGIVQGPAEGWASPMVIGAFVVAALLFGSWTAVALHTEQPLLDPRLLHIPALRASCLGMGVAFFGMFGFFYLNASLLQYGRGYTVFEAGLGVVPMTLPMLLGARFVPRLVATIGERVVLGSAFVIIATGLLGAASSLHVTYAIYAVWLVVLGTGLTLALPTLTIAISSSLPREQAGVAGGLQATTRELGSALGVAVIGSLVAARTHGAAGTGAMFVAGAPHALTIAAVIVLAAGTLVVSELRRPSPTPCEDRAKS